MSLELAGIHHAFGAREVLRGIDLSVGAGEIVCLLGPSGDGKTTLLRLVAGLEALQRGRIAIGNRVVAGEGREEPPEARHAGFVFQDYALFPHLTVARNVGFGLGGLPRAEREARVMEALERVGLGGFAGAWPHMLSGGQQQRVALARALAPRPAVLLLDEAFASLDARLREQVRDDTLEVLQSAGTATLIVTHDAEEAMFMADRIALLRGGRVEQLGTPEELYLRPASRFAATFLGEVNTLPATVSGGVARAALGSLPAALPDGPAELLLRPEGVRLLPEGQGVPAVVEDSRLLGASSLVRLAVPAAAGAPPLRLHARLPPGPRLRRGDRLGVALDPERAFVFSAPST
ncbi:ABC transporter ATP-binding protein [Pseudoroseomonas rhizosphaerae]|uniref:ABC transporter ATP-binding protein n=1 Tax=Teichococcus rhizosphaerae TaxID=1335062 RepID=A0A2C7AGH3_9PROT|nr:ABC transporter ATP-binding protein [Pseudoroseomonas rhizosphaerae]PHK96595.1 ABC transporter ATP-binding protein [Pseudoroseomonas rhizosphaerae]